MSDHDYDQDQEFNRVEQNMQDHGYNIGHDFGRGVELNMHDVRLAANFLKATTHKLGDLRGREGEVPWD